MPVLERHTRNAVNLSFGVQPENIIISFMLKRAA
jgi:hypothetical protein